MHARPWSLDEFATHDAFALASAPEAAPAMAAEPAYEVRMAAESARVEADAYARGRADGERAARAALDHALAGALQALGEAVESVRLHEARWLSNAEENIAALSVLVARHVVQAAVEVDPTFLQQVVQSALQQCPAEQEITVRLHPDDLAACRSVIAQHADQVQGIRWIADPSIVRGGCLTEGRERIIDGRVDTALERAYRMLAGVQAS
ncbi:MAG: flagellar assembly protein FliH [Gemmatimonadetes bacterium]|nr:flagellar assembly protein FliH [Gemmatimonadota bacterium]